MDFGIARSPVPFLQSHESLVFLSSESWHDKYAFGLSMWLCEITGLDEDVGSVFSGFCKGKCSACWILIKVNILSEILPHTGINAQSNKGLRDQPVLPCP